MNTELRQPLTELPQGGTLAVRNGRGRAIVVVSGQLWVTQDDDLRDIVVGPGESFQLDRNGLALATAFDDSQLMLLSAEPSAALAKPPSHALALLARRRRHAAIARAARRAFDWLQRAIGHALTHASAPVRRTLAATRRDPKNCGA